MIASDEIPSNAHFPWGVNLTVKSEQGDLKDETSGLAKLLVKGYDCHCFSLSTGDSCTSTTPDKVYGASLVALHAYTPTKHKSYQQYATNATHIQTVKIYKPLDNQTVCSGQSPTEWSEVPIECFIDFENGICGVQRVIQEFLRLDMNDVLRWTAAFSIVCLVLLAIAYTASAFLVNSTTHNVPSQSYMMYNELFTM